MAERASSRAEQGAMDALQGCTRNIRRLGWQRPATIRGEDVTGPMATRVLPGGSDGLRVQRSSASV